MDLSWQALNGNEEQRAHALRRRPGPWVQTLAGGDVLGASR